MWSAHLGTDCEENVAVMGQKVNHAENLRNTKEYLRRPWEASGKDSPRTTVVHVSCQKQGFTGALLLTPSYKRPVHRPRVVFEARFFLFPRRFGIRLPIQHKPPTRTHREKKDRPHWAQSQVSV